MTSYTNIFGGNAVRPADQSLSALTISANTTLTWPEDGQSPATSAIIEVSATSAGFNVALPDARRAGKGETVTFRNTGANSFTVTTNTGVSIVTVGAGLVYTVYLSDNSTQSGTWSYWQAGAGSSTVDAAAIDGAGLEASAGLLRVRSSAAYYTGSRSFTDAERGSVAVWQGGSGTFTMPAASVGNGWYMIYKNAGTGTLSISAPGVETFDGSTSISVGVGEAVTVFSNGTNFSFVRYAASSSTNVFSYTEIDVSGAGSYTLSAAEYDKKAIKFTGVLTGNRQIIVPASVRDYWVNNATTGAYTLRVNTATGTTIYVTQGQKAILYCDGVNMISAETDWDAGEIVPIANGGTGASSASSARTNLAVPGLNTYNTHTEDIEIKPGVGGGNANFWLTCDDGTGRSMAIISDSGGNLNIYDYDASNSQFQFRSNGDTVNVYTGGLIGYGTGAGGTVTQATSKSTAVTLNTGVGTITTAADSLGAGATVFFTVNNSLISSSTDVVHVHRRSGGTDGAYRVWVDKITGSSFIVGIQNTTGGALAEAIEIKVLVFNGAIA